MSANQPKHFTDLTSSDVLRVCVTKCVFARFKQTHSTSLITYKSWKCEETPH